MAGGDECGRVNPKIPLTDLCAFPTTTDAERRSVTAQGRDVTATHLPKLVLGSTQAGTHLPPRISSQTRRGRKENRLRFICKRSVFVCLFFVPYSFPCLCFLFFFFPLSGQRCRSLVRGLTISSIEDAARLPRRRRDPLSSDPRSGRPG